MSSPDTEFIRILGATPDQAEGEMPAQKAVPKALPETLPVLGLSDIVIFPGMVAPLLVDTAESIRLIDDVVEGDRLLALVLQKKPEVSNPLPEDLYEYACGARERIASWLEHPRVHVVEPGAGFERSGSVADDGELSQLCSRVARHDGDSEPT